jgi:predicted HD superfamily hydrolase involved in NAD metabolism
MQINQINQELSKRLSHKRHVHCGNVAKTAVTLSKLHQIDSLKAEQAGLLHDIAKDYNLLEALRLADKLGLTLNDEDKINPALIHSKLGSLIIADDLGFKDQEILDAVHYHTTGRKNMGQLELLIYVCDYLDPDKKLKNYDLISHTAAKNLHEAALLVCICKIEFVLESMKMLNLDSIHCYNWLVGLKQQERACP